MKMGFNYVYNKPASFLSLAMVYAFSLLGFKRKLEKRALKQKPSPSPARIPFHIKRGMEIDRFSFMDRPVWHIKNKGKPVSITLIYLHGGMYLFNISSGHWMLIDKLVKMTGVSCVVPDYPLAPEFSAEETVAFMQKLYRKVIEKTDPDKIVLIGDSAGAGLALTLAQRMSNTDRLDPSQIILLCPWLNLTMANPQLAELEQKDMILSRNALIQAARKYAGKLDLTDPLVSPIFGPLQQLGEISLFTGTNDLLFADATELRTSLLNKDISFNYFEYPGMFHDWMLFPFLPEGKTCINQLADLIRNGTNPT